MRIGIFVCADGERWGKEEGIMKMQHQIFSAAFNDEQIELIALKVISQGLPSLDEIKNYDGFIIPGSHYSVDADFEWIHKLEDFIRCLVRFHSNHRTRRPKLIGLCFGHQLISKALGGEVGRNKHHKFCIGSESIVCTEAFTEKCFYHKALGVNKAQLRLLTAHSEEVTVPPETAMHCGSSEQCENEILMYNDAILTFQAHPDFPVTMITDTILPFLVEREVIPIEQKADILEGVRGENDGTLVLKMIKEFIYS